jgi:hypothetical protein
MPITQLSLAVVGADYANKGRSPARRFEIQLLEPGEPVDLIPEPKNPVDPRAVAVFSRRSVQIGYLTAERCGWIGAMLGEGREIRAVFQSKTRFGCWIRAAFDGEEPVLPPVADARAPSDDDTGFYADPDWPDE